MNNKMAKEWKTLSCVWIGLLERCILQISAELQEVSSLAEVCSWSNNVMDRKVLLWCVLGQWVITSISNSISMANYFFLVLPLTKSLGSWVEMTGRWGEARQNLMKMCLLPLHIPAWWWMGLFSVCFLFFFFNIFAKCCFNVLFPKLFQSF